MLHIALCDDQMQERESNRLALERWLQRSGNTGMITAFSDGESLLRAARDCGGFDLYLLDILMPGENGVALGQKLRQLRRDVVIIYLTSSPDFALEAYEAHPLHYLLKPVSQVTLFDTLDEAAALVLSRRADTILARSASGETLLTVGDILYAELSDRKVRYHLSGGRQLESVSLRISFSEAMADLLRRPCFVLSGSSYAVNLDHVRAVERTEVVLSDGARLTLPKRAHGELRNLWMKYWLEGGGRQ